MVKTITITGEKFVLNTLDGKKYIIFSPAELKRFVKYLKNGTTTNKRA